MERLWMFVVVMWLGVGVLGIPTQTENLVVLRDDKDAATTTTLQSTTEEPLMPIKILEMDVRSEISLRYSQTAIVTKVRNPSQRAQETTFYVLLPEAAFISGFVMTLNGKSYKAYVKDKETAKEIFNEAVSQGVAAAHIATTARDSNQFTVSVNVEPNTEAVFNMTYEELLERRNGVYNHAINLNPRALVPKFTVTVHIKEEEDIVVLRVPEIRTGNEIDATESDTQNPIAKIEQQGKEATVTFTPNLEEQQKLMTIYEEKSRESAAQSNEHDIEDHDDKDTSKDGSLGQLVVQYDVKRNTEGVILVNDGYFVYFFAPSSLPVVNKQIIFVLDTSGSMMGRKINQLKDAMYNILDELHPGDYFNIVEFAYSIVVHDLKDAMSDVDNQGTLQYNYQKETTVALVPPSLATKENIERAKIVIRRMTANGGTDIGAALATAIDLSKKGVKLPTSNKTESSTAVKVNPDKDTSLLQPIILFLTDGEPTVGDQSVTSIIKKVSESNTGERNPAIFSLAFGTDADRNFLRKLSLRNNGFTRYIYEAADANLQLQSFYKQISSPLLSNVRFTYPPGQVKEGSVTKDKFHTYYKGSEIVVAGRTAEQQELTPTISFCGVKDRYEIKKYEVTPKLVPTKGSGKYLPLERLWAYLTIKQLLDNVDADEAGDKNATKSKKEALDLALKYSFVTPLTSLVVVKPNSTDSAVNPESADIPRQSYLLGNVMKLQSYVPQLESFSSADFSQHIISEDIETDNTDNTGPSYSSQLFHSPLSIQGGLPGAYSSNFFGASMMAAGPPAYLKTSPSGFTVSKQSSSNLYKYRLSMYPWAEQLLKPDTDALLISSNGTTVELKLSNNIANDPTGLGVECDRDVTGGSPGVCTYLPKCPEAQSIDATAYATLYCDYQGYAGVCCPKKQPPVQN